MEGVWGYKGLVAKSPTAHQYKTFFLGGLQNPVSPIILLAGGKRIKSSLLGPRLGSTSCSHLISCMHFCFDCNFQFAPHPMQ